MINIQPTFKAIEGEYTVKQKYLPRLFQEVEKYITDHTSRPDLAHFLNGNMMQYQGDGVRHKVNYNVPVLTEGGLSVHTLVEMVADDINTQAEVKVVLKSHPNVAFDPKGLYWIVGKYCRM